MVFEKICALIAEQFAITDPTTIKRDTAFVDDLGLDSLDVVELTMAMEEEFAIPEVPEDELKSIITVGDLADYVSRVVND